MRLVKVKYGTFCAETGAKLPKGVNAWYDDVNKKMYAQDSKAAATQPIGIERNEDYINDQLISNYNGGRAV